MIEHLQPVSGITAEGATAWFWVQPFLHHSMTFLGGLVTGMWFCERGRRRDAQIREGLVGRVEPRRWGRRSRRVPLEEQGTPEELKERQEEVARMRQRMIDDAMSEGLSQLEAEKDADQMLAQLRGLGL